MKLSDIVYFVRLIQSSKKVTNYFEPKANETKADCQTANNNNNNDENKQMNQQKDDNTDSMDYHDLLNDDDDALMLDLDV